MQNLNVAFFASVVADSGLFLVALQPKYMHTMRLLKLARYRNRSGFPLLLWLAALTMQAQHAGFAHETSEAAGYVWPEDAAVREKLADWQQLKFGVLVHWGLYSVPGIVESWSICSEDVDWIPRRTDMSYDDYKAWYRGLADDFRPQRFDAADWARTFHDAGARYAVLTTKHHDGFCLFDTRTTDYSLPAHGGPDAVSEVFRALRRENLWVGAYFSKPDWSCPWYWNPNYATPNRRENYRRDRHPEWWQNYRHYTQQQLREILSEYGPIDLLWLDGGWVSGEEIGLDTLLAEARGASQGGMLCVDRTIRGCNENYLTPERGIPATQLGVPWESCIPLSNDWGWMPNAPYKSWQQVVGTLAEVVAKGGSLLLGIGPCADGTLEAPVRERLADVGRWLRTNGDAIYGTRTTPDFHERRGATDVWFTRDDNYTYAIVCGWEGGTLSWHKNLPHGKMVFLGSGRNVKYRLQGDSLVLTAEALRGVAAGEPFVLRFPTVGDDRPEPVDIAAKLQTLSLREKIGQLRCVMGWEMVERTPLDGVRLTEKFYEEMHGDYPAGGLWATLRADPWTQRSLTNGLPPSLARVATDSLQAYARRHAPGGTPLMLVEECPHGHMAIGQTVFPTGLGLASTWDEELLRAVGRQVGREARRVGATLGLGPVLDVARDPRWSRMEETLGEDPVLAARLGTALMGGMQECLPACLKHFAAYGVSEGGHNGGAAWVGENYLHRQLLPPFEAAVRGGAAAVMTSYNTIDGIPATAHQRLITDVLRDTWNFHGIVVSDLYAIDGLISHGLARNRKEAAAIALRAGVDIDLGGNCYAAPLEDAVREGLVTEAELDRAVARVLKMKYAVQNTSAPSLDDSIASHPFTEGIVLLKNNGLLPLRRERPRIAIIGPNADTPYNQLGDYTAPQADGKVVTPLEGLRRRAASLGEVEYVRGCGIRDTLQNDIEAAVEAARRADVIVLVLGGSSARDFRTEYRETGAAEVGGAPSDMDCGEGFDRSTLQPLGLQRQLLEVVAQTGTPLITIYIEGRPLLMERAAELSDALLCAWYPGERGGEAIAAVLLGEAEPSGRLPVTIPRSEGQLPLYYAQGHTADYADATSAPLYPFGYGLGYAQFSLSDLRIDGQSDDGTVQASVTLTNTGRRAGTEVVQLYQHPLAGAAGLPALQLSDFHRVTLDGGASTRVALRFRPLAPHVEEHVGTSSAHTPLRLVL